MIKIGKIVGAFGLKGEIKIYPMTNHKEMFLDFENIYLDDNKESTRLTIVKSRIHKNTIIATVKEIHSIDEVDAYMNKDVYVEEDQLPILDEDEQYLYQIIGMDVFDLEGEYLGKVEDVFDNGAHSVYVVKKGDSELLLPGIPSVIIEKDFELGRMAVNILPGLLD